MTDWSKRQRAQQQQRERREWIARAEERERLEREQASQVTTARAHAALAGYQHQRYEAQAWLIRRLAGE